MSRATGHASPNSPAGLRGGNALELAAVILIAAASIGAQDHLHSVRFTRFDPPAFDANIYAAMADDPRFFTVAPWGYRILTPWLASLLPFGRWTSFHLLALAGLFTAACLLHVFLRRLGHRPLTALAGVAVFCLSPPLATILGNPFLTDPLTVALEIGFLVSLESKSALPFTALLALLGGLSKELFLLFLPGVYFVRRDRDGDRAALRSALLVALPALLSGLGLRLVWTAHLRPFLPDSVWGAGQRVVATLWAARSELLGPSVLAAVLLAAVGALRASNRQFISRYGYLCGIAIVAAYLPPALVDSSGDVRRLLIYVVPLALPLALWPLDQLLGRDEGAAASPPARGRWAAAVATATLVVLPLTLVDSYRRADLRGPREGRRIRSLLLGSLATARSLEQGRAVSFATDDEAGDIERVWYLFNGWRQQDAGVVTAGESAGLLVPCLRPEPLALKLTISAVAASTRVSFAMAGRELGSYTIPDQPTEVTVLVPAATLLRGDNLLAIRASSPLRLFETTIEPITPGPSADDGRGT